MNILKLLKDYILPDQAVFQIDPSRYRPLETKNAVSDSISNVGDEDSFADSARAHKDITDLENELQKINNDYKKSLKSLEEAQDMEIHSFNLVEFAEQQKLGDDAEITRLNRLYLAHAKNVDTLAQRITRLRKSEDKVMKQLSRAKEAFARAIKQENTPQQSTDSLQTSAASPTRITPLQAVFQFAKGLLSDAQVQQQIANAVTGLTTAAIIGRVGVFSHNSSTTNLLEAPAQTYTNSTHYQF